MEYGVCSVELTKVTLWLPPRVNLPCVASISVTPGSFQLRCPKLVRAVAVSFGIVRKSDE